MKCPKCIGKLDEITVILDEVVIGKKEKPEDIKKVEETKLILDQCFVCKGVWFDKGELEKYLEKGITIVDSPPIEKDLMTSLDNKSGKCPRCEEELIKIKAPKNPNITIDICPKCSGIWLDNTEIDELEKGKSSLLDKLKYKLSRIF